MILLCLETGWQGEVSPVLAGSGFSATTHVRYICIWLYPDPDSGPALTIPTR